MTQRQNMFEGAEEMAQPFRVRLLLQKTQGQLPTATWGQFTPVLRDPMPSCDCKPLHQTHNMYVDTHAGKILIHIKEK